MRGTQSWHNQDQALFTESVLIDTGAGCVSKDRGGGHEDSECQ